MTRAPAGCLLLGIGCALAATACEKSGKGDTTPPRNDGAATPPAAPVRLTVDDVRAHAKAGLGDWFDPDRGLIIVAFASGGGSGELPERKETYRVCAPTIDPKGVTDVLLERMTEPYEMTCAPDGERTVCKSGGLGEYDLDVEWTFAPGAKGPFLESMTEIERATMSAQWIEEGEKFLADKLAEQRKGRCE